MTRNEAPKSETVTTGELKEKLGRKPTVNEWLEANGREPVKKIGRKTRRSRKAK